MEKVFNVHLRVNGQRALSTLLEVTDGTAEIVEIKEAIVKPVKSHAYVGGKRDKGIRSDDLIKEIFTNAKRPVSHDEISKEFVRRGFAGNSCSPSLSVAVRNKKIHKLPDGRYEAIK
jgi:hypothetical protein